MRLLLSQSLDRLHQMYAILWLPTTLGPTGPVLQHQQILWIIAPLPAIECLPADVEMSTGLRRVLPVSTVVVEPLHSSFGFPRYLHNQFGYSPCSRNNLSTDAHRTASILAVCELSSVSHVSELERRKWSIFAYYLHDIGIVAIIVGDPPHASRVMTVRNRRR